MIKLLSKNDIQKILTISDTINILEKAFVEFANGSVELPERIYINSEEHSGMKLVMPGYLRESGVLGTKIVTVFKNNLQKFNLPSTIGTIMLLNEETGEPIAIMDGTQITAYRTGAAAGLAVKHLARENAATHVLFGTGGMAGPHALAVNEVRNIERLIVLSTSPYDHKKNFVNSLKKSIGCEIIISEDPENAVNQADIISLITTSREPLINYKWLKPGTHINSAGSHSRDTREIDADTIINGKCICDSIEACRKEAGDFIIPAEEKKWSWNNLHGSLGDICSRKIPARESENEITVFKSVGLAIQDLSTADYVYRKAMEHGIGTDFSF